MGSPTYTVTRERVTWTRWDVKVHRTRISHPVVYTVHEDGEPVKTCNTKHEALAWIEAQS
jgi:hypothetical protein